MTRLCVEQEYPIDAVPCTSCGHCETIYYADTEQEYMEDEYYE